MTNCNSTGYPQYRRRNHNKIITYGNKTKVRIADNRYIVPYNAYLSLKYNCHINVEVCSTILCIKYLFKYVYKGYVCAYIKMSNINVENQDTEKDKEVVYDHDEIKQYLGTRYVCPPEACHRIFEYIMHKISHAIYRLAVHEEDQQIVYFQEGCENECLSKIVDTTLIALFKLNQEDSSANKYYYHEINKYYVFNLTSKKWTKRK